MRAFCVGRGSAWVAVLLLICAAFAACSSESGKRLSGSVERMGPYVSKGLDRPGITDDAVIEAMSRVPRHEFVRAEDQKRAYEDRALPIGSGQTISQPYIVALMSQEARIRPGVKVLEVGTGSGYQAAVMSQLGASVFSVEILPELAANAEKTLKKLNYDKVKIRVGDGWEGWPDQAPFDAILVTAAAPRAPAKLLEQLADSGRLVIPIEDPDEGSERLMVFERKGEDIVARDIGSVKFVPLTGKARDDEEQHDEVQYHSLH